MNEDPVEVFEVSEEEWNAAARRQLDRLGLTRKELEARVRESRYTAAEFKAWMIVHPSTIK